MPSIIIGGLPLDSAYFCYPFQISKTRKQKKNANEFNKLEDTALMIKDGRNKNWSKWNLKLNSKIKIYM